MRVLDVRNADEVTSVGVIQADLGVEDRRLLVLSGIATPEWSIDDDDNLYQEDFQVRLGVYASTLEQASVFVGLASISNDDSEFVFAVDTASVAPDPASGELVLQTHAALQGDGTGLNRFSYQVVATVVTVRAHISGTITWPTSLWRPIAPDPAVVGAQLGIVANKYELLPPSGPAGFSYEQDTPLVPGYVASVNIGADKCSASYRIDNPPLAEQLRVTVAPGPELQPGGGTTYAGLVNGPAVFTLTVSHPALDGEDFAIYYQQVH